MTSSGEPKRKKMNTSSLVAPIPEVNEEEDEYSYVRHIKSLKAEWGKRKPNAEFIHELMKITSSEEEASYRRAVHCAADLLIDFPCLASYEHVSLIAFLIFCNVYWFVLGKFASCACFYRLLQSFVGYFLFQKLMS